MKYEVADTATRERVLGWEKEAWMEDIILK
jgi:hypothetical protein